ncbi:monothiol glutaredoxin-S11 [Holospora obtusa F1]|uniref:Glutaredoxin n=1 Tax=Holospora obtusa F1 TaxID=1399147 RepID=W6TG79_HOLOB|nr:Grx4 family monothiol glutaredoxin [Holospora obtusa]ETZ06830.1 monothiol glutaredoxin-S11 [Holospora obtusa F1]
MNSSFSEDSSEFHNLRDLIYSSPIMLFMKGSPDFPLCGFSKKVVEILKFYTDDFGFFDVLKDDVVREKIKIFSNWPTFPQVYARGELIGGCDIVTLLHEQGSLREKLSVNV